MYYYIAESTNSAGTGQASINVGGTNYPAVYSFTTSNPNCPLTPVTKIIFILLYNTPFFANLITYLNTTSGIKGNTDSISIETL